jgi:hypothetical protein
MTTLFDRDALRRQITCGPVFACLRAQRAAELAAPVARTAARGFCLHAAARVPAADRQRLEHLGRYLLRPPLARPPDPGLLAEDPVG